MDDTYQDEYVAGQIKSIKRLYQAFKIINDKLFDEVNDLLVYKSNSHDERWQEAKGAMDGYREEQDQTLKEMKEVIIVMAENA